MIKETNAANEAVMPNNREIAVLKDTFPSCLQSFNGLLILQHGILKDTHFLLSFLWQD